MESGRQRPFRARLSRVDYSALEEVSRGVVLTPHLLIDLDLISPALGGYLLTAKGSFFLTLGPTTELAKP